MISADEEYTAKKNRKKQKRVILQMAILVVIATVFYLALFTVGKYKPYEPTAINMAQDKGFIALSYFGVDRVGHWLGSRPQGNPHLGGAQDRPADSRLRHAKPPEQERHAHDGRCADFAVHCDLDPAVV